MLLQNWILASIIAILLLTSGYVYYRSRRLRHPSKITNIYDITIRSIDGNVIKIQQYVGKYILVVNTASKCGFTEQYSSLQHLYELYQDRLVILGVPANQFLHQEPDNEATIKQFCSNTYGVTFPMTEKLTITGPHQHPLYQRLTRKSLNGARNSRILRNFQKYLISPHGQLIDMFTPQTKPFSEKITKYFTD